MTKYENETKQAKNKQHISLSAKAKAMNTENVLARLLL